MTATPSTPTLPGAPTLSASSATPTRSGALTSITPAASAASAASTAASVTTAAADVAAGAAESAAGAPTTDASTPVVATSSATTAELFLTRTDSPIGRIELTADADAILSLHIERGGWLPHDGEPDHPNAVLTEAVRQLAEYFDGERHTFDLPVRLAGTPFQLAIWQQLQRLDWGDFVSYGELGAAAGRPGSGRAVGGAVGSNPIPIIVGCHRVLASNQKITGYSGGSGIPTKIWLLDHERIGHL